VIAVALSALAAYPAYRLGGRESLQSMLFGAALSWLTIVASYLILTFAFRTAKELQVIIVVGGFVVRIGILFGLLKLISYALVVNLGQLVLWMVSFYVVLVVAEAGDVAQESRTGRSPEA
jgi:hypothetical protein